MRRLFLASVCVLSLSPLAAQAEEFIADSELTAATVYTHRAAVTRTAKVALPPGKHTLVFRKLPGGILPDSLRAEGEAQAEVTLGALSHKIVNDAEITEERARLIVAEMESIRDKIALIGVEKQALEARRQFIQRMGEHAALRSGEEIAEINLKPAQWVAAAVTIQTDMEAALKKAHALGLEERELNKQLAKLEKDLGGQGGFIFDEENPFAEAPPPPGSMPVGPHSYYEVTLPVEAETATNLTVALSYQVPDASWAPLYDARLDTKTGEMDLVQYGAVQQNTGEDWEDVALTLSTAQPHRGATLPVLQTNWINVYMRQVQSSRMAPGANFMEAPGSSDIAQNYEGAVMDFNVAQVERALKSGDSALPVPVGTTRGRVGLEAEMSQMVEEPLERWRRIQEVRNKRSDTVRPTLDAGGFVAEYKIPGPSSVKADGTQSKLMIAELENKSAMHVRIQPQTAAGSAYLATTTTLGGEAPALPGAVSLFRDDAYVGRMQLPMLRPGKEQVLYFGIDDQFAVKRDTLKDEKSEAGVIARDRVLERHYVTEIVNLHSMPFDVVVEETIPVSRDEKAKVEILPAVTTAGYVKDEDNTKGLLRWRFRAEPKEEKDIKLGVKVTWPADAHLQGM